MKMKKIFAALAASAMAIAMLGLTVSAEGVEADEDVIDDTEIVDDIDDVVDDTDVVDDIDVVDDVDVPEEPAEVPAESNPGTGNSPVALAVIPVALAAAAVVAKKAK